jgi:hypothetical protein
MKYRFTLSPTGFTKLFMCDMPTLELRFGREKIIEHPPPKYSNLRWYSQLP